jgi:hypothetical protein
MTSSSEAVSRGIVEKAALARSSVIGQLAGYSGTDAEREALAGSLFRQYSYELLQDLLKVASAEDKTDDTWVRRCHDEQLLDLGRGVRDAFPEGESRHAVAQVIQRELLEAERRLKDALRRPECPQPSCRSDSD